MKKPLLILSGIAVLGLLVPVFYILIMMGIFSHSPKVEILNNVSEDAPVLRVAADYDFSPYSFYDSNDQVTGLDVELINEIANRLGMKAEITFTDWISCKKMLQTKETDLILGLEIFSNLQGVKKTIAVSNDKLLVFGKKKINDLSVLRNKKVGLITNSVIEKIFDLNCEYVPFYTNTQILEAINNGTIDYGICHGSVGKKILEKSNYDIEASISLMDSYPAIGVRDDLPELRNRINDILIQLSEEGVIKKLDEKWLIKFSNNVKVLDVIQDDAKIFIVYFVLFVIAIGTSIFFINDSNHKMVIIKNNLRYQTSLKKQNDMLTSIANVYYSMHAINLVENTVKEIKTSSEITLFVHGEENASGQMENVMRNKVIADDLDIVLRFTDLKTLPQRLKDKKSILLEFRGVDIGWLCGQFIAMDYDENGEVTDVMFTIQNIDDMKKEMERLLNLSHYDELTHLLNRHAYDAKIEELKVNDRHDFTVVSLDVNGLKTVNDEIGHLAGDELICGAAECISECFKNAGTSYRMGGDEFLVLIEDKTQDVESLIQNLKNCTAGWNGNTVKKLSISMGYVSTEEISDFTFDKMNDLIKMSDKRMYADKAQYYQTRGIDRRK